MNHWRYQQYEREYFEVDGISYVRSTREDTHSDVSLRRVVVLFIFHLLEQANPNHKIAGTNTPNAWCAQCQVGWREPEWKGCWFCGSVEHRRVGTRLVQ